MDSPAVHSFMASQYLSDRLPDHADIHVHFYLSTISFFSEVKYNIMHCTPYFSFRHFVVSERLHGERQHVVRKSASQSSTISFDQMRTSATTEEYSKKLPKQVRQKTKWQQTKAETVCLANITVSGE